jgi:hypothetical protein
MDLSIAIPQSPSDFFTRVSTYHSPYSPLKCKKSFPSVPKKENIVKSFSWGEFDIQDLYDSVEETVITFENSFYKPYFPHNTRILIKREIENINNMTKLYLLVKDNNSWLRTTIILNNSDPEGKYYDYKYKNIFNMF